MKNEIATVHAKDVRADLDKMDGEFSCVLPAHIPVERFKRVAMTAIQSDQNLIGADRRSLFRACVECAQDGLFPDGREAALVVFKQQVQYMPMVAGIIKKARNSGEISSIGAHVVHDADSFRYWVDEAGEHINYEPHFGPDRGNPRLVFAFAKAKDGALYVEPMTIDDINDIRKVSRAKDGGPWSQWWGEMARKTAIRRLSKRLPLSTDRGDDLRDVLDRDNKFYDLDHKSADIAPQKPRLADYHQSPEGGSRAHPPGGDAGSGSSRPDPATKSDPAADPPAPRAADSQEGDAGSPPKSPPGALSYIDPETGEAREFKRTNSGAVDWANGLGRTLNHLSSSGRIEDFGRLWGEHAETARGILDKTKNETAQGAFHALIDFADGVLEDAAQGDVLAAG